MDTNRRSVILRSILCMALAVLASSVVFARGPNGLADVTILATGGTIAGTGATSTTLSSTLGS